MYMLCTWLSQQAIYSCRAQGGVLVGLQYFLALPIYEANS